MPGRNPVPPPHKRTKSGIARTLLHRVSSRSDVQTENTPASSAKHETGSSLAHSVSAQSIPASTLSRQTTMPPAEKPKAGHASIEQSVKMFRLYEALRSGDTAAISKSLKEGSANPADRRASSASTASASATTGGLEGTTVLHLATQCADIPVIEYILANGAGSVDINARDKDGNTPLHIASSLSRAPVVRLLLTQPRINDSLPNYSGRTPLDLAKNPEVFQHLQLARSMYIDQHVKEVQALVAAGNYDKLEKLLTDPHFQSALDVNGGELATDPTTIASGGTLLHEAARKKDAKLIQLLLLNGADPFRRDRKGKLPQDATKDDKTRALLKKSPAAAAAQQGIQEKTILRSGPTPSGVGGAEIGTPGKESREMKGYLKKWTNYTSGYKLRWFVLEDGVMSYYKHQDDAGSACRGAINMRIARLHMDAQDKLRFEIHGKSSVKYHLKANHQVEAKRWFWALNNAIQWTKDTAKDEQKRTDRSAEALKQAKSGHAQRLQVEGDAASVSGSSKSGSRLVPGTAVPIARSATEDDDGASTVADPSVAGDDMARIVRTDDTTVIEGDIDNEEEYGDDASSVEAQPVNRDAYLIAAQSSKLQLDLLEQITMALQSEKARNPDTPISEPTVAQALVSYESAIANLKGLVGDMGRIGRDREAYWHYRLEQEVNVRRIWEDSMAKVAKEQEELEQRIGESEEKRRRTKRALRDALEGQPTASVASPRSAHFEDVIEDSGSPLPDPGKPTASKNRPRTSSGPRRRSTIEVMAELSGSDDDDDEEFFDAVGAGEVEVVDDLPDAPTDVAPAPRVANGVSKELRAVKHADIRPAFKGYEDPVRTRLKMDADDRPKISLWGILKSMIGKDMTKMTLPVSFNEPTSLLQRVAEDMEYTDLLDIAADRADSTERMVYVAAFAASEYASTIGRVAKPFNPLLGETYEYARPDKGYRFFIEQVSHHPPIGAAWAESPKWDYYGESAVRSKFYGKSFDINPLGTWFLKLRPNSSPNGTAAAGGDAEELYTWKKVTSSVIGIITGNPTVDNYGPMEIKNHTTGEVCILDFKPRGWKASSAYQVTGKVLDARGSPRWSMGGRWNDKIYARLTPGYESVVDGPSPSGKAKGDATNQAFLVWEAHGRPTGIPFNLTPFVLTLNAVPERLRARLPPTDTRLRPDQRAMEDGEYDFAATEKNRVEEKQRATRRWREANGTDFVPQWFVKSTCPTTGEEFWDVRKAASGSPDYWEMRDAGNWERCEDIF